MTESRNSRELDQLIRDAQRGSEMAWRRLVESHYGLIHTIAYSRLADREAAEDLTQEVFLRAWLQLKDLRKPASFPYWVGRMARHLSETWRRNNQRRSELVPMVYEKDDEMEGLADGNKSPREEAIEKQERETLLAAIDSLPPQEREITMLHYLEGMPKNAIAKQVSVHPATVGRVIERSLESLRAKLGRDVQGAVASPPLDRSGPERSIACVAMAAALSPAAKQALVAAAAEGLPAAVSYHTTQSVTTFSAGFLTLLWQSIQSAAQGLLLMNTVKATVATTAIVAAASIGGYAVMNSNQQREPEFASNTPGEIVNTLTTLDVSNNPILQQGEGWRFHQRMEIQMEGNWFLHAETKGQCKVVSVEPDQSILLELLLDEMEVGQHWQGPEITIIDTPILIAQDSAATITSITTSNFTDIESDQVIYLLTALAGTDLGPLLKAKELKINDEVTIQDELKIPSSDTGYVQVEMHYKFRSVERRSGRDMAIFDVDTNSILEGLVAGGDPRTRTSVRIDRQESVGSGEWAFDLENPANSQVLTQGTNPVNEMSLLVAMPGSDQPFVQPIPTQPGEQHWRMAVTYSEL